MGKQWLAVEHYRLHDVEQWPEGRKKCATLAAIRSKMESLSREPGGLPGSNDCLICLGLKKTGTLYALPISILTTPGDVNRAA
jgi:hypothetical protein